MNRAHFVLKAQKLQFLPAFLLFLNLFASAAHAQITPLGDSYVNTADRTTNYGSKTLLDVDGATQTTYIQFNLASIPSGATVSQATLKLYVNAVTTAGSFNVDYATGAWSEGTIDASNAPPLGAAIASNVNVTAADKNQYILVDVTSAVQAWLSGSETNNGIALVANSSFNATFDSKENTTTSHPPELDIVVGGGGSGTITGVTAGTALTGGGTSGTVTLNVDTTKVPLLAASNTFTGNQTVNGNIATSGQLTAVSVLANGVTANNGAIGVTGSGEDYGVEGFGSTGLYGYGPLGVDGESPDTGGTGVFGYGTATGVFGSGGTTGVEGSSSASEGYGVYGESQSSSGIGGGFYNTTTGDALFAYNQSGGYAAFFDGNVDVDGKLSKAGGSFKIDHPLDPANKYLYHSFVESPDMMNIYNGNVVTDGNGDAVVQLPDWFEALNRDFRYQLTVIGQFARAIVASEVSQQRFTIKTDQPNVKVSWQVTGIRQDAWANANRIQVEVPKAAAERGFYLHPELFGAPPEKSIAVARHPMILKPPKQPAIRQKAAPDSSRFASRK
jgi:TGF-beta propeptide